MLKLYGSSSRLSPNTHKLRVALAEAGGDYEFVPVDLAKGEQRRPEFVAVNPHAKVPAFVDGDVKLAESNAILFYIAEKFPAARLLPADAAGRARAIQWCDFTSMSLYTPHHDIYVHTVSNPPAERVPAIAARATQAFERALGVLETVLSHGEALAGPFSIADIACAATLRQVRERLPAYADLRPATAAWYGRVTDRPAWQRTLET